MDEIDKVLAHFGVKGMKWGVRRNRRPVGVTVTTKPGGKIKTSGGKNQPASKDAVTAARLKQRAKKSKASSLSNAELQALIRRMQLERQFKELKRADVLAGSNAIRDVLNVTKIADEAYSTVKGAVDAAKK